ncbi:hypothetical protein ACJMK2_042042 [Sinanodonta woodiana]|uniref:Uncharacterized protein n=1 Tax=Sinanodonta woodiana TaxID=1069815 RepID=A0ABD3W638_SINWO
MTVKKRAIVLFVLAIGICIHLVEVLECPVAKEPIRFTGGMKHTVDFDWNCTLLPNESVNGVQWFKDSTPFANVNKNNFTFIDSYVGRVERFGTFGIRLHNITVNDSGHYHISVTLNDNLKNNPDADTSCQSVYLPALTEEFCGCQAWNYQQSLKEEGSSGSSKLEIGLMIVLGLVVIFGLGVLIWCIYHKRRNNNMRKNGNTSQEQSQML